MLSTTIIIMYSVQSSDSLFIPYVNVLFLITVSRPGRILTTEGRLLIPITVFHSSFADSPRTKPIIVVYALRRRLRNAKIATLL